jgi:hypothetical protein
MLVAALVAVVVCCALIWFVQPSTAACKATCKERVAAKKCKQSEPRWCVERAILTHRIGPAGQKWLRRIPGCESGWSPTARHRGSGAGGLYQFIGSTWATTPYARRNVFRAKWNALAAAWMWRQGRAPGEWSCK